MLSARKLYFLLIFFVLGPRVFFSTQLQGSEAQLHIFMQLPRICKVVTKIVAAPLNIIPQKNCKTEHYVPHVFSIFLTYNGSSSVRLILLPDQGNTPGNDRFHFQSSSNPDHKMLCTLINTETEKPIVEFGTLYHYAYDVSDPIIAKEFKIGIKISPKEIRSAQPGIYNCCLKTKILEGD